jgi:UV DNA damage endonuclease
MYNLCCISNELKQQGHSFKTMTWKRFNELIALNGRDKALYELGERWLNNVRVTAETIRHCGKNGWGYRISSDLFPLVTHPDADFLFSQIPQYQQIVDVLRDIAATNKDPVTGNQIVRLSTHPDQFNVLASENIESVRKTIRELSHHAMIMDMMGCEQNYNNPINIHVNCTSGTPEDIAMRFAYWLSVAPHNVRSRLVVENEDKGIWTVSNLLKYFWEEYGIPITFDNLHHKCNPCDLSESLAMAHCAGTWYHCNAKPLFHYSESCPNNKNKRAHAEMPTDIPPSDKYDFDIELKNKDKAIRALYLIELTHEAQSNGFYDIGPQRGPSSVAKINAETKSVNVQLKELS